jgi:hypothetical protein
VSEGIRVDSRALDRALEELAAETAAMPETWAAVAERTLPAVRDRTPVRTGTLQASWTAGGEPGRGTITSDEEYAGVIESREHVVRDALAASPGEITAALEDEVAKAARRIGFEVRR